MIVFKIIHIFQDQMISFNCGDLNNPEVVQYKIGVPTFPSKNLPGSYLYAFKNLEDAEIFRSECNLEDLSLFPIFRAKAVGILKRRPYIVKFPGNILGMRAFWNYFSNKDSALYEYEPAPIGTILCHKITLLEKVNDSL